MFLHYASGDDKMQHAKVSGNELSFVHVSLIYSPYLYELVLSDFSIGVVNI